MRLTTAFTLALLTACNSGGGMTDDTIDTAPPPPEFNFRDVVQPTAFDANINANVIGAHQMTNMMLASMGVVSSDIAVQGLYNSDGGGDYRGTLQCWVRPQFPRWSFDMNFASCKNFDMNGAVNVSDHPAGMLLFSFSSFEIGNPPRSMGGSLAFDRNGANPEPLFWSIYDTADESPGPDNRVPIGVTLGGERVPKGLSYEGGANVNLLQRQINFWGEATISGDPPITVVHGADRTGVVAPDDPPGADAVSLPLDWTRCRCPTSGVSSLDMPLEVSSVTLDIDDMDEGDDGFDDAALTVIVDHTINGRTVLTHTGCGTYDVEFTPEEDPVTIQVDGQALFAQASFLCDTRTIEDPLRCDALFRAITEVGDTLTVQFSPDQLDELAALAVDDDFDTGECQLSGYGTKTKP